MALVLAFRPRGLFVAPEARKDMSWIPFLLTVSLSRRWSCWACSCSLRTGLSRSARGFTTRIGAYAAGVAANQLKVSDAAPMCWRLARRRGVRGGAGAAPARYRSIFFAMLSLALSMILYGLLVKTSALGPPTGSTWRRTASSACPRRPARGATAPSSCCAAGGRSAFASIVLRSRLGRLTPAVRDNELRSSTWRLRAQRGAPERDHRGRSRGRRRRRSPRWPWATSIRDGY